ncbi:MAG: 50S ribosomal protein L31e [archaeon]
MAEEKLFTIPLRREFVRVPKWRRTKRAVDAVRAFVIRYAKAKEVRIGRWLNLELWGKGAKNPPSKVYVKITKDKDVARVELAKLPPRAVREAELMKSKDVKKKKLEAARAAKEEKEKKEEDYKKKKEEEQKKLEGAKQAKVTREQEMSMHK